jgi:adenosylcobinamide-phosphate synthase
MSFFAILFALLLEQVRPLDLHNAVYEGARGWARWVSRNFDAGQTSHAWLAWSLTVLLPAVLAMLVHWLLVWNWGWTGVVLAFIFHAAILYATLGFRQFSHHFTVIRDALDAGDETAARSAFAKWKQVDAADLPHSALVRHVLEHSVLAAHRHVFGVLGWYALLSALGFGPAGAVLYRLAEFSRRYYAVRNDKVLFRASAPLTQFAQQAWSWLDYLPARFTALGFAIVGNFEEAVDCWRSYAQRLSRQHTNAEFNDNDGLILAAASGALSVSLGGDDLKEIPQQTEPQTAHLRSIVGLVWRSVVLWMLLLALLTLAHLL